MYQSKDDNMESFKNDLLNSIETDDGGNEDILGNKDILEINNERCDEIYNMQNDENSDGNSTECILDLGECQDIFNIYLRYYKDLYKKKAESTLFDGINMEDETSTNRALEILYSEYLQLIYEKDERFRNIYDIDEYKSLYMKEGEKFLMKDHSIKLV